MIFQPKTDFPPKPLLQILPCKNPSKIMIITSHMQKIIQIHPCLLSYRINKKVWRRTDGRWLFLYPPPLSRGDKNIYYQIWGQSWLYGCGIYNYLCNQCTSPLMLWVRIRLDEVYLIQHYVIKFVSDLRQVSDFLWVLRFFNQ